MNNISVKCPICNQQVTEAGINAHLDSNCQYNIVQMDGTVVNLVNDRDNRNITSNGDVLITSKFQKTTPSHIYLGANSVEKKKTVQSTLFSKLKRKSNDDNTSNNKMSNHSLSQFKSTIAGNNNNTNNNNNYNNNINNNNNNNKMNNNNNNFSFNKKIKIEDNHTTLPRFDMNKKHDNIVNTKNIRKDIRKQLPLAELVRPKDLEDYFGQEELMGNNSILKTLILEDRIPSMILWGPPGVGN